MRLAFLNWCRLGGGKSTTLAVLQLQQIMRIATICVHRHGAAGEGERREKGGRHGGMTKREKGHVDRERQLTPALRKIAIHSPARDPQLEKMETYEGEIGVVGAH
jgi:hypothetical protein